MDGDTQIQNQENNLAHADVDEEHNLAEITDLEEAEEEVSNIQDVSTVMVQIMMNVIVQRINTVIDRNVAPINVDEKKSMLKDRRLGLQHLKGLKVKLIRPMKNFRRQPGTKQLKSSITPNSEMFSPQVMNGLLNRNKCQLTFTLKDPLISL